MKARFVIDWDDTLCEDRYPDQGPWLPGAVEAIRKLERLGTVVIMSCRVAPYAFPSANRPEDDILRDPVDVALTIERMSAMLVEEGLGHIEIWQRGYKPPATVYIDNKGVHFDGDWDATLERVLDLIAPVAVKKVEREHELSEDCWCEPRVETVEEAVTEARLREEAQRVVDAIANLPKHLEQPKLDFISIYDPENSLGFLRHPSSARFHQILQELGELHDQKSIGYGTNEDPLANVRGSQEWGMPAWVGAMVRAGDKIKRLQAHAQKGDLPFEAIEDAFRDLAVYSVIGLVLYEQEQQS